MWTAMAREREVHRLLTRERILGLDLVKGVKPGVVVAADPKPVSADVEQPDTEAEQPTTEAEQPATEEEGDIPETEQVTGLPLFGGEAEPDT